MSADPTLVQREIIVFVAHRHLNDVYKISVTLGGAKD